MFPIDDLSPSEKLLFNLVMEYKQVADVYLVKTKYAAPYREAKDYLKKKGVVFKAKQAQDLCLNPFETYIARKPK